MMRWTVTATKRGELEKSINLLQIEGSFANIDITDVFGIAASTIVIESSAAPSPEAITFR
jgi:hypothetical protein